ncbi:MAG: NAD(P)-dependent oxidoreductase [Rhodospirillales bacterium]
MAAIKILVCGATGFIGRNIAESLANDNHYEVIGTCWSRDGFNHPRIRFVRVDLTDPRQVNKIIKDVDVVVQAAATTSGAGDIINKPYIHVTDNAVMNSHILRAAFEHKTKHLIFFSCTIMYPSSEAPLLESDFNENTEINPRYYGAAWTKVYIEKMCEFFSRISESKFTVLRHSNIYGPHDKFDLERSHVFGATVTKVMTASGGNMMVWGNGEEERDLLYIDDLVTAVQAALNRQLAPFGLYNIGSGKAVSVKTLVEKIIRASGRTLTIEYDLSMPTIKTGLCVDCGKAATELGWRPTVTLDEGIARTVEWYRRHVSSTQSMKKTNTA